jgi:hypothetical protein
MAADSVGAAGFEPADTSVPSVADRREDDGENTAPDDAERRMVSASAPRDTDEAIRVAAKLALDAGDLRRARALIDLLDSELRNPPVLTLATSPDARKTQRGA